MQYAFLGRSTLTVSRIGFGCMSLSKTGSGEAQNLIKKAVDAGINYFDTADLYDKGTNESLIGGLLKPVRNKILIATKVGNQWREDGSGWNWNPRKNYILKAVDASLARLQTDYIDLYQLHGGTIEDNIEEAIEAFELLVSQGKIRYYGISSIRPNVIRKYVALSNIQSVMLQYSLLDRRPEEEILPLLHEHKISVMARGVLAQGLLVDKHAIDYLGKTASAITDIPTILKDIGQNAYSPTSLAVQYVLNNPAICSAVIGFRTTEQLQNILQTSEAIIPKNVLEKLSFDIKAEKYTDHR